MRELLYINADLITALMPNKTPASLYLPIMPIETAARKAEP
jgi:hypothetical protein